MSTVLVTGVVELVTNDPQFARAGDPPDVARLGLLPDAAVVLSAGRVLWVGPSSQAPQADSVKDLGGRVLMPGFVDSHTHLVFAGDRSAEFAARMAGTSYDGGGVASTVEATRAVDDAVLSQLVRARLAEMAAQGTLTAEIKTGYGLSVADELRSMRVARALTPHVTLLGAHVVPPDYARRRDEYVSLVTGPMLAAATQLQTDGRPLAESVDVFCEPHSPHAFTEDEARTVLQAGARAGLRLRVHGNQLGHGPGVALACELGAASVDHCTYLSDSDLDALRDARDTTCATLLPGVELSTRSPFPDARRLLAAGVRVALATDCNPGTCYSSSMPLVIALAVTLMRMTPAEAVWAATAEPARSLGLAGEGSDPSVIAEGHPARLVVLDAPSHVHLAYRAGVPLAHPLRSGDRLVESG